MLAELDLFFIRTFNGKELYSILPERQEMDLIPGGVQACGSNHLMHFLNIFHLNGYMIDRTGLQLCGLIFICLDHKIAQF